MNLNLYSGWFNHKPEHESAIELEQCTHESAIELVYIAHALRQALCIIIIHGAHEKRKYRKI